MRVLQRKDVGMSLVELLVVLAIVGILAMVSTPFMGDLIGSNRIDNGADQLASTFRYARGEALSTGLPTSVCISSDSATCTGSSWAQGWIVYRSIDDRLEVLQAVTPSNLVTISNGVNNVTFNAQGVMTDPAGASTTFQVTDEKSSHTRNVTVSQVGRVSKL